MFSQWIWIRMSFLWFATILSALYLLYVATVRQPPVLPPPDPVVHHETRGPRDPSDVRYEKWISDLRQQTTPTEFGAIALLQMASDGIHVNAEIPVWGVFLGILTALAAFVALREQMKSHIKTDETSFKAVKVELRNLRNEVRSLQNLPYLPEDD